MASSPTVDEPTSQGRCAVREHIGSRDNHGDGRRVVEVALLTRAEWPQLRTARLRALHDSPDAFLSEYERERGWSQREWLRMFESAVWVVARSRGRIVGLARSSRHAARPWQRHVESVWVEPRFRRRGITRRLIEGLIQQERGESITELAVWVIHGNDGARRVYERLGFRPTGERQRVPEGADRFEERLLLRIDAR
jgi:L-amino acid N-acyltransferase YncA